MPSARSDDRLRRVAEMPGTVPRTISAICAESSGSRLIWLRFRRPLPQPGRRSLSSGRASVITKIGWLRDRSSSSVDEVEHAVVGPLQVLEDHHGRPAFGNAFEERAPRGEELVT